MPTFRGYGSSNACHISCAVTLFRASASMVSSWVLALWEERMNTCKNVLVMDWWMLVRNLTTTPSFPQRTLVGQEDWNTAIEITTQGLVEAHRRSFRDRDKENVTLELILPCKEKRLCGL